MEGLMMKSSWRILAILFGLLLFCWGCSSLASEPSVPTLVEQPITEGPPPPTEAPQSPCGDGVCDSVESIGDQCPQDCEVDPEIQFQQIDEFEYYVKNPSSGSNLYVKIFPSPMSTMEIPTLILIPGGTGDSAMFTDQIPGGSAVEQLGQEGFHLVVFDPEGRGSSEGVENFNGHIGQDGLYAVTLFVDQFPTAGQIGYFSQSYGVSLATGVLARYPDAPVEFLIDWEGPANREDITIGCRSTNLEDENQSAPQDRSCSDDPYWSEREAEIFISTIKKPYHRLQSLEDHAQPDVSHAEDMIRAATGTAYGGEGQSLWTRLNDLDPNTVYTPLDESLLSEIDRDKYTLVNEYARTLFDRTFRSGSNQEPGQESESEAILYLGLMVHLEGWFDEVDEEDQFRKHMDAALELADVFEEHGAWVTFEASPETIEACAVWENVLLDLQERGHGIGVHADRGYSQNPNFNLKLFTAQIKEMKEDAEALGLVIEHVSGICSDLDWAKAAIDAGYVFTTGGVGYCAMSMPEEMRPGIYRNCLSPAHCHGNFPMDMASRLPPWRISSATGDWIQHDPDGELVILSSDSGIKNLFEETQDSQATHGDMEYTEEDIDVLVRKIEEALALVEPGRINQIYFSLSIGAADVDEIFYNRMFAALQPFVDSGKLEYKTLNEIYHLYTMSE
jgi:pimeloyl-ACP methyl ester carboxylesterase